MENISTTQQVRYTLNPQDRRGNPAPVDGIPVWATSNSEVATVEPSEDGLSAVVKGVVPGTATISVTADAKMGEGVVEIAGVAEVTVSPAAAVTVALVAGPVEEQPE